MQNAYLVEMLARMSIAKFCRTRLAKRHSETGQSRECWLSVLQVLI